MARARLFTLAFGVVVLVGLAVSVAIPLILGPRPLTIAVGSSCFVALLVAGSKLVRRVVMRGPRPGG